MTFKMALAATTTAVFLTGSGLALAQQTTPPAASPSAPAPTERMAPPSSGAAMPADRGAAALSASSLMEVKDKKSMVRTLNVSADDLEDMDIYGSDGKKIGDVNKILADNSHEVKAVTVDVGGFLGIGAREVVIPIDRLQKGTEKDRLQVTMTKADIEQLQRWEDPARKDATPGARR